MNYIEDTVNKIKKRLNEDNYPDVMICNIQDIIERYEDIKETIKEAIKHEIKTEKFNNIKFKTYDLIEKAIEEGIENGWRRCHKYEDNPPDDHLKQQLLHGIMLSLDEIIDFNNERD